MAKLICFEPHLNLNLYPRLIRRVPTTPDPNTSEKVSRYKWEAYRDTNWWCIYSFLPSLEPPLDPGHNAYLEMFGAQLYTLVPLHPELGSRA